MSLPPGVAPVLLVGAGRLGGALLQGWAQAAAFAPGELLVRARTVTPAAEAAARAGAALNPPDAELARARTVVLAVKPYALEAAAAALAPHLAADAAMVSLLVGKTHEQVADAFAGRPVARAMPTTAAAIGRGVTTLYAPDPPAAPAARALFAAVGEVVEIAEEALMLPATAVSGSAPGYLYAFVEALERAGVDAGLAPEAAARLARGAVAGAAELMARSGSDPADLRRQVASPGGTTEAALRVLAGEDGGGRGLPNLLAAAVAANIVRAPRAGRLRRRGTARRERRPAGAQPIRRRGRRAGRPAASGPPASPRRSPRRSRCRARSRSRWSCAGAARPRAPRRSPRSPPGCAGCARR